MIKFLGVALSVILLALTANTASAQVRDGYIPVSSDKDDKAVSGVNVPLIFVYSSGSGSTAGTETPLTGCTPQTITVKGTAGEDIATQSVCERVEVATNPDKLFTVSGLCSPMLNSTMKATCTATNENPDWQFVYMNVRPMLDNRPQSNWPSMYCPSCTWTWVQTSNSCQVADVNASGIEMGHNFAGNPSATCETIGYFRVDDSDTSKTWNSPTITARLAPTVPDRDFIFTNTPLAAKDSTMSGNTVETQFDTASVVFTPRLAKISPAGPALTSPSWPTALKCPGCVYSHTIVSNTCNTFFKNVHNNTVITHNVDISGSCSVSFYTTVSDATTNWSARQPTTGNFNITLRKQPATCTPYSENRYVPRTDSCASGNIGSNSYEAEQQRDFTCANPYSTPTPTAWYDTGITRFENNTCTLECVPEGTEYRWSNASSSCPSGQYGTITWEAQESRTSTCATPTSSPQWSAWAATGNTQNVINTCTANCSPEPTQTQWVADSATCPSGQVGSHTWESEQTRTSSCSSPTASPAWSAWSNTGVRRFESNTCATSCTPAAPQTQWVADSATCPSGQVGSHTWESEQTRISTCSSPTASPAWSAWSNTGVRRFESNTCAVSCTPNAPETRWIADSSTCPPNHSGSVTWEYEQERTSTCPSLTGSPVWSAWSNTSNTRNANNTCAPEPATCVNSTNTRWVVHNQGCPTNYSGSHTWEKEQSQAVTCSDPYGSPSTGAWTDTSNIRGENNSCAPNNTSIISTATMEYDGQCGPSCSRLTDGTSVVRLSEADQADPFLNRTQESSVTIFIRDFCAAGHTCTSVETTSGSTGSMSQQKVTEGTYRFYESQICRPSNTLLLHSTRQGTITVTDVTAGNSRSFNYSIDLTNDCGSGGLGGGF